jgi:hypothetical protein
MRVVAGCFIGLAYWLFGLVMAFSEAPRLTVEQVVNISKGLAQLDCLKDVTGDKEVCHPYKFSGATVLAIANDLAKTRAVLQVYQDAHNRLLATLRDATGKLPPNREIEFVQEDRKIADSPANIELNHIKWAELKVGTENQIPPSVIALIQPIIDP